VPSQKQLRWSQLRVGLTVLFASITLAVLIFLMTGTGGLFTKKITLKSYFDNTAGLRVGAPVRVQGVDIGNVVSIRLVPNKPQTPVEVTVKVSTKYDFEIRKDSVTILSTAGVLGEVYVDIDSTRATGPMAQDGDVLQIRDSPDISDVVRASQGTLQNLDALLKRLDRIVAFVESGQGSIGKLIYDPTLYNRFSNTVQEFQDVVTAISKGKGSIGKLIVSDDMYNKANATVDKLNLVIDEINQGKGTAGKFLKDPTLYDNANQTIANVRKLTEDVNAGKGALGKMTRDEEFARKLDDTVTKLNSLVARMDAGEGTVGKLFHDPSLYTNADQMLIETRQLVKAIRENPKKYLTIHFRVF
jgi:phospholipid/cholesterol/gamma-HCH transport system substrate-binding protein